ncbi:hypothetical protein POV27_06035 [Aureisphaera galaxeae]|uniref:hypothetical protein n=1 Tax=Aureisphaera galaxeae TaxID=1538023 RepID=UPI0023504D7A|nr:hypothetical protein [Aureisphaera galaxeae]MDC8003602.1 hypothetical protein [Aureisphaera galaxeae]
MKTSIKIIVLVMFLLGSGPTLFAQRGSNSNSNHNSNHNNNHNCSSSSTTKSISLEDSSKNESVTISVTDEVKCLNIGVSSNISSGALTMEIYNPEGDKQGNFSVESELNSSSSNTGKSSETVCGQLNKTFKEPMKGDWVIKLKPKKVTGKVQIHSHQASSN